MPEIFLIKIIQHNNWANNEIIRACAGLNDEQLDAKPINATYGTIRETLTHLVRSQLGYLSLLTLPLAERVRPEVPFERLKEAAITGGEGLLDLAEGEQKFYAETKLQTRDGFHVEPWVVMVQAINHAAEHREQICAMLTALGITPPFLDGWAYGEVTEGLVPIQV